MGEYTHDYNSGLTLTTVDKGQSQSVLYLQNLTANYSYNIPLQRVISMPSNFAIIILSTKIDLMTLLVKI